jgi:hypothetical protein
MWSDRKLISSERVTLPSGELGWNIRSSMKFQGEEKVGGHFFPDSALAIRAAEYGIDPNDINTLLDVLLNEVFIVREEPHYVAETRATYLRRCALVKLRHRLSTRPNSRTLASRAANPSDPLTAAQAEAPHPLQNVWDHLQENPIPPEHVRYAEMMISRARREMGLPDKNEE